MPSTVHVSGTLDQKQELGLEPGSLTWDAATPSDILTVMPNAFFSMNFLKISCIYQIPTYARLCAWPGDMLVGQTVAMTPQPTALLSLLSGAV